MSTPTPPRRGPSQSRRGDGTGHRAEVLAKEAEELTNGRREELGMTTNIQTRVREGITDLTDPERPMLEDDGQGPLDLGPAPEQTEAERLHTAHGEATYDVEILPEVTRRRAAASKGEVLTTDQLKEKVVVDVIYDVEAATIGYGNTYDFVAGRAYRVPRWVAAHLEEKSLGRMREVSVNR